MRYSGHDTENNQTNSSYVITLIFILIIPILEHKDIINLLLILLQHYKKFILIIWCSIIFHTVKDNPFYMALSFNHIFNL